MPNVKEPVSTQSVVTGSFRWAVDSLLFAMVVVSALSLSSQTAFRGQTVVIVAMDTLGGLLFLSLPLLLFAVIRFNWLYRNRQGQTGYVLGRPYFTKTAVMATVAVTTMHMFAPSWTLLAAIGIAWALSGVLTLVSPVRATRR